MRDVLTEVLQELRRFQVDLGQPEGGSYSQDPARALLPGHLFPTLAGNASQRHLPLPGLFGRFGVLPDYFTDEIQLEHPDQATLRQFLDIFNHRLYVLLLEIWQRYHFFSESVLQPKTDNARREAFYLNCLAGTLKAGDRRDSDEEAAAFQALRWHKISIYRRRKRSVEALRELLSVFFPDLDIRLRCMVPVSRPLPSNHRFALDGKICLGQDGLLGESLVDLAGGIRLEVLDLTYAQFLSLNGRQLPKAVGAPLRSLVRKLVNDFTKGKIQCFMSLNLRASEVPSWSLGQRDSYGLAVSLGQQVWLQGERRQAVTVDIGVV